MALGCLDAVELAAGVGREDDVEQAELKDAADDDADLSSSLTAWAGRSSNVPPDSFTTLKVLSRPLK